MKIREIETGDYDQWLELFKAYAEYYQSTITPDSIATTWGWLTNAEHPVTGMVVEKDGALVGFAHYRGMPGPLRGAEIGFLDDLFVHPDARGTGAAEGLIKAVHKASLEAGWPVLRWITKDDNYRARQLYDKIGVKTDWNTYEMKQD